MARTPEAAVKHAVVAALKARDIYHFFPATAGYGRSGVPDIICCIRGTFVAIECKADKKVPTALQEREMSRIRDSGGFALVANPLMVDRVIEAIHDIMQGTYP
jgi:Holliday junction resolvase